MRLPAFLIVIALAAAGVLSGCSSTPGRPTPPSPSPPPTGSGAPSGAPSTPGPAPTAPTPAPEATRSASTTGSGSGQTGPAQTPDERRAAIDRNLDGSLGTFDDKLRKEQEVIAQERDAREAEGSATAVEEAESSDSPESPAGNASVDAKSGTSARPGDLKSDKDRSGSTTNGNNGEGTRNIPDGSDDDIVARRLRKAAEQETDPELKEKLWKEYIEYKKNTGT